MMKRLSVLCLIFFLTLPLSCSGKQELQPVSESSASEEPSVPAGPDQPADPDGPETPDEPGTPDEDLLFGGGAGTADAPYRIATVHDLDTLAYLVNVGDERFVRAVYHQVANISGASLKACIGRLDRDKPFCGLYYGNGFHISGLSIADLPAEGAGLFGYTDGAVLDGIILDGFRTVGTGSCRGALAGVSLDSVISNCCVNGTVSMEETSVCGGLAGSNRGGIIRDCQFNGVIRGGDRTGGIVGEMYYGTISGCAVSGAVTGACQVGGVAGAAAVPAGASLLFDHCVNTADVTADYNLGGILGYATCGGMRLTLVNGICRDCTLHATGAASNHYARVGGILGGTDSASSGPVNVLNTCSYGLRLVLDYEGYEQVRAIGGIVGSMYCDGTIAACWSDLAPEDVTARALPYYKGAIVGYKKTSAVLSSDNFYDSASAYGAWYGANTCVGLAADDIKGGLLLSRLNAVARTLASARMWTADRFSGLPVPDGGLPDPTDAQAPRIRILAIGNSFSQDATEQYLCELLMAAGYEATVANCYIGGCTLEKHWNNENSADESLRNSNSYRKVVQGIKTTTGYVCSIARILMDEPWDYVIFQQGAGLYGILDSHYPYLDNFVAYVAKYLNPGTYRLGYQMTWGFPVSCTDSRFAYYDNDQMKMYEACRDCAYALKERSGLDLVIPTGTAIQNGRTSSLGDTFNRDWGHLDYNHGRYTASCTWFETITGIDVTDNTYAPDTLTPEVARICRRAAHAAVASPRQITRF